MIRLRDERGAMLALRLRSGQVRTLANGLGGLHHPEGALGGAGVPARGRVLALESPLGRRRGERLAIGHPAGSALVHTAADVSKDEAPGTSQGFRGLLNLVAGARSDRLHTEWQPLFVRMQFSS